MRVCTLVKTGNGHFGVNSVVPREYVADCGLDGGDWGVLERGRPTANHEMNDRQKKEFVLVDTM